MEHFKWLQCFKVYACIYGAQFLEVIPELMAYMDTIIRVIREYTTVTSLDWVKYVARPVKINHMSIKIAIFVVALP